MEVYSKMKHTYPTTCQIYIIFFLSVSWKININYKIFPTTTIKPQQALVSTGFRDPTSLRGSRSPSGRNRYNAVINIGQVRLSSQYGRGAAK